MDAGTSRRSHVPSTTSTRRNHGDANRSRASTDASKASVSPVNDNVAYLLAEGVKAEVGLIPRAPEDPSLLVNFNTHVVVVI